MYYKRRTTDPAAAGIPVVAAKMNFFNAKTGGRHNKNAHMHVPPRIVCAYKYKCVYNIWASQMFIVAIFTFLPARTIASRAHAIRPSISASWRPGAPAWAHANEVILRLFVAVVMMSGGGVGDDDEGNRMCCCGAVALQLIKA